MLDSGFVFPLLCKEPRQGGLLVKAAIPVFLKGDISQEEVRENVLKSLQKSIKDGYFQQIVEASSLEKRRLGKAPIPSTKDSTLQSTNPAPHQNLATNPDASSFQSASPLDPLHAPSRPASQPNNCADHFSCCP
jgi:hypothetical protein